MRIKSIVSVLLSLCVLFACTGCFEKKAEKPKVFSFEQFTYSKGLPCERITCMAAFGGKVWAGSEKGLFAYDGVNWEIHSKKNNNFLGSDIIWDLKSMNSRLYISTDNAACFYDGNRFKSVYTGRPVSSCAGSGNEIAVGTAAGVVVNGRICDKNSGLANDEVKQVIYDKNGQLWVGTNAGISKMSDNYPKNYKGPQKTLRGSSLVDIPPSPSNCQLSGNYIKAMILYKDGFAIGTTQGLSVTDMNNKYENYTAEHLELMQINGKIDNVEVGGNSKIPGNKIRALAATDKDELLFVVTDKGLGILQGTEWLDVDKLIPGLPKEDLTSVAWLQNDLWVGGEDGIYRIKGLSALLETDKN